MELGVSERPSRKRNRSRMGAVVRQVPDLSDGTGCESEGAFTPTKRPSCRTCPERPKACAVGRNERARCSCRRAWIRLDVYGRVSTSRKTHRTLTTARIFAVLLNGKAGESRNAFHANQQHLQPDDSEPCKYMSRPAERHVIGCSFYITCECSRNGIDAPTLVLRAVFSGIPANLAIKRTTRKILDTT